jgi:hypothetical protein
MKKEKAIAMVKGLPSIYNCTEITCRFCKITNKANKAINRCILFNVVLPYSNTNACKACIDSRVVSIKKG